MDNRSSWKHWKGWVIKIKEAVSSLWKPEIDVDDLSHMKHQSSEFLMDVQMLASAEKVYMFVYDFHGSKWGIYFSYTQMAHFYVWNLNQQSSGKASWEIWFLGEKWNIACHVSK